jgi:hypothetical protein
MQRYVQRFCGALVLMLLSVAAHAQTFAAGQVWVNQRQSALAITLLSPDGVLRGTYTNQAAGFDCKNIPFEATGWVAGDFITFQVKWKNATKDCNSLTAWTGYYSAGTLYTKWDLVYVDATTKKPTLLEDKDSFTKK